MELTEATEKEQILLNKIEIEVELNMDLKMDFFKDKSDYKCDMEKGCCAFENIRLQERDVKKCHNVFTNETG